MSRYDMVVRGGTNFDDHYPATGLGFIHEKTEEVPETTVAREDL